MRCSTVQVLELKAEKRERKSRQCSPWSALAAMGLLTRDNRNEWLRKFAGIVRRQMFCVQQERLVEDDIQRRAARQLRFRTACEQNCQQTCRGAGSVPNDEACPCRTARQMVCVASHGAANGRGKQNCLHV